MNDIVSLSVDDFGKIRKNIYDLWRNEPFKLNAFIDSNEFPLVDFTCFIYGREKTLDFVIKFHYSPYTKVLKIDDEQHGYVGEVKNVHVVTDIYSNHKGKMSNDITIQYKSKEHKAALVEGTSLQSNIGTPQNWVSDLGILFYGFNMLVLSLPKKIIKKEEKATKTIETKKNGKKVYKSVVYLKNSYSVINNFKLTKSDLHHIIKCPAWGVRGHKRHLSNGTVVFVKPYVKGKYRNDPTKYIAKVYKT